MQHSFLRTLAVGCIAALSACGGGGDGNGADAVEPEQPPGEVQGPLDRYLGTYSECDQRHARFILTVTNAGDGSYHFTPKEVVHRNADCTGEVLGEMSWSAPSSMRYVSSDIVTVRGEGLPASLTIDRGVLTWSNSRPLVTGPGARSNCVVHPDGETCFNTEERNRTGEIGLYLSDTALYALELDNGVYVVDEVHLKD